MAVAALGALMWSGSSAGASLSLVTPDQADAGYFTSGIAPTSASTTFVLPTFTCTGVQEDIISVQVNFSTTTNSHGIDEILITCTGAGASPQFSTLVIAGGTDLTGLVVTAGDTLRAAISGSATRSSTELENVTSGKTEKASGGPQENAGVNAFFGIGRLDSTTPAFSALRFKALKVDGAALTPTTSFAQDMTSASSVVQARARPVTSRAGVIVFKHS